VKGKFLFELTFLRHIYLSDLLPFLSLNPYTNLSSFF